MRYSNSTYNKMPMHMHKRHYTYATWEYEMFKRAIKQEHYEVNLPEVLECKSVVLLIKT